MAGTWRVWLSLEDTTFIRTRIRIKQSITPKVRGGNGTQQTASTNSVTKTFYCSNDASSISGYNKLKTVNDGANTAINASITASFGVALTSVLIKAFATDAGEMDGYYWNAQIGGGNNMEIRGHYSRVATSLHPDIRDCKVEYYHRAAGGAETLLATDTTSNFSTDEAEANKDEEYFPTSQFFTTNDRLVLKFYGRFRRGGV